MNNTITYYNQNAEEFYQSTVHVDMSELHVRFLKYLPAGSLILDAGCGSGRDTRAFLMRGYQVEAFDASPEMVKKASLLTGLDVQYSTFSDLTSIERYEGIWACASLLHLPEMELPDAMQRLFTALKTSGVLYLSFKKGDGERIKDGRHFTDLNEESLQLLLGKLSDVKILDQWLTTDVRKDRDEVWLNAVLRKIR